MFLPVDDEKALMVLNARWFLWNVIISKRDLNDQQDTDIAYFCISKESVLLHVKCKNRFSKLAADV